MLTDRGVAPDLRSDELDPGWLAGVTRLHLPAYSLVREPIREAALAAADAARAARAAISVDLSATRVIADAGADRFRRLVEGVSPDVIFATDAEAALLEPLAAPTIVVKRGAEGCIVRTGECRRAYPAEPADVVDATGAGDAFAAGFLLGGPDLALRAAARCVATMGAFPP